ncbi:MAG: hypothetical protein NWF04_04580 [Candidatus Bathyarchaeota archaeon]|nr:hypothetical protein [Candidatus Bathyarchaeota archaeon]
MEPPIVWLRFNMREKQQRLGVEMGLSQEEFRIVKLWLAEKDISAKCPVCEISKQSVGDIVELPQRQNAQADTEDNNAENYYAAVPITCRNCGHVRFFSAKKMGLVK